MKRWVLALGLGGLTACGSSYVEPEPDGGDGDDASVARDSEAGPDDAGVDGANDLPDAHPPDAAPDAGVDAAPAAEECSTAGETRIASCGNCGERAERCVEGIWTAESACLGQGECAAATVDTDSNDRCLVRQRLCSATCEWGAWNTLTPEGECSPGAVDRSYDVCTERGMFVDRRCSETCEWVAESSCRNDCPGALPADRVCVSGGDVIIQDQRVPAVPPLTVTVSPFVMDRYDVSRRQFDACVASGHCTFVFVGSRCQSSFSYPCPSTPSEDEPAYVTIAGAEDYCAWIGGRLPTYAEHSLAARGPAPRSPKYPWWNGREGDESNDAYGCEPDRMATGAGCRERRPLSDHPVDHYPESASFFGVEGLWGSHNDRTWLADGYVPESEFATVYQGVDPFEPRAARECATMTGASFDMPTEVLGRRREICSASSPAEFRCVYPVVGD